MKILLPPSETKRQGGSGGPLRFETLELPSLTGKRVELVEALVELSSDVDEARRVLKLSERQAGDVEHNRMLRTAPTMAAIDRYTGVLYDALDAASLDRTARRWLGEHVLIHSAPFGPIGALDEIPVYRLAAGTSLPGIRPLRRHWAEATSMALSGAGFVLDLRSESYVALGPVAGIVPSAYVRVVTESGRALNHFNKKAKGEFVRALATTRPRGRTARSLIAWASENGIRLREADGDGVLELVVDG